MQVPASTRPRSRRWRALGFADAPHRARIRWIDGLVAAAVLASITAYLLQRHGAPSGPDGTLYTGVANHLGTGKGLTVPFTTYTDHYTPAQAIAFDYRVPLRQWPPLYPAVLSMFVRFGATAETAARILNPALLGVNVVLAGVLTRRLFPRSWPWYAAAGFAVVLLRDPTPISSSLLYLHASTFAEPMFLTFVLATLIAVDAYLRTRRPAWLLGAATIAALAALTKILGLSAVATVCLVALVAAGSTGVRLGRAALCAAIGALPVLPTLVAAHHDTAPTGWSSVVGITTEVRTGLLEMATPSTTTEAVTTMVATLLVIVGAAATFSSLRRPGATMRKLAPTAALATLMATQLVLTRVLIDRYVSLQGRHLAVVQVLLTIVVLGAISSSGRPTRRTPRAAATLAAAVGFTAFTAGAALVTKIADPPYFDSAHTMPESAVAADGRVLFSNAPDELYASNRTSSYLVPCTVDYYTGRPNPTYSRELQDLQELVRRGLADVLIVGGRLGASIDCANQYDLAGAGIDARQLDDRTILMTRPHE